jgi:hypothetical protein
MRTKALLLTAAVFAAGIVTSLAQPYTYSVNIVGYINVTLTNGFTMVANQLHNDLTGTNDTVQSVFGTNLPSGSVVYAFTGGGYANPAASYTTKGGWGGGVAAANAALSSGSGVFVKVPSPVAITLVGNVMTGTNNVPYVNGFNLLGSPIPQAGLLQADLGYTPTSGDVVYQFVPATQQYKNPASQYTTKGGWAGAGQPNLSVGEAFFLKSAAVSGGTWTRAFNP